MTAITTVAGVQDTESGTAAEHVIDMAPDIAMLDPDTSQFMTILQKLPSRVATQVKVNWLEDQLFPNYSSLANSAASGDTSLVVATGEGAYFRAQDIVFIESTGEKVIVSSVSSDTLTVARALGGTAAATADTGVGLLIVGNASRQGADTGTLKATVRVLQYNYSQIFRMPWGFTGTEAEVELYGADDPERETAKKTIEHKRQLELAVWLGARSFSSASNSSLGTMGGVKSFLTTNVFTAFGAISLTGVDAKLEQIYQHGSLNKVAFCGPIAARGLSNAFATNWVRARPDDNVYGAKVSAFLNGNYGASLPIIVKRDWGNYGSAGYGLKGSMFVLDLDLLSRRPMRNRDTRVLPNRQGNGQDQVVFDILTEQSFQLQQEKAHGVIHGITG